MSAEVPAADKRDTVGWGPIAFYGGVVKSVPFEARYELILVRRGASGLRSEERVTGAIYRDSAGRVRREYRTQVRNGEAPEFDVIVDQPARTVVALDIAAKTATRFIDMGPPPTDALSGGGWAFMRSWSDEAGAGHRTIEGVVCRKMRPEAWPPGSPAEPKAVGEIWVSDELKYSVLERVSDSQQEHTWRLYDIQRVEPPSSLFAVPAGYTEVVRSKSDADPSKR